MSGIEGLSSELTDLARALGATDADGAFDPDWLAHPLDRLDTILSDADRRAALLRLLDALLPPAPIEGLPDGEKWHPLLGDQPHGNLYLTVRQDAGGLLLGVAADFGSAPAAGPQGRMRAQIPLIRAAGSVTAVAGTAQGPLTIDLRIDVGWVRDATVVPPRPVGLRAVAIRAAFDPRPSMRVVLEDLQLDERPPVDRLLDAASLGREAPEVIASLLKVVLAQATPSPQIAVLAEHLLGLFGLAEADVPAFPFAELADGPAALQRWLDAMLVPGSASAPIRPWLEHLAGLIGTPATADGDGTEANPWRVRLVPLGADAQLAFTASRRNGTARLGLEVEARGTVAAGPALAFEGAMALADVPLAGTASARPLPAGAFRLRVSGTAGSPLVDNPATLRVGQVLAGIEWNGSALDPLLALVDVRFAGAPYPRLDLTNVDSVVDAASSAVLTAIAEALGPGAGRQLAALAGIAAPSDPADPTQPLAGWPHHLQPSTLVTDPAGAFGAYHRDVLLSATHGWDFLLRDLAALAGLDGAVSGSGTRADPWRVALAAVESSATVELAAWNDAAGSSASDPQRFRIGLRLAAGTGPIQFVWLAELLAFDLPASGAGDIAFVGAQRARIAIAPAFEGALFGDVSARVDAVEAEASWRPGAELAWSARAVNVRIIAPEGETLVPALTFPPAGGFDVDDLASTAGGFGVTVGQLESLVRILIAQLASLPGPDGRVLAACLGLHRQLPGFDSASPTLDDPAFPGRTLSDPVAALRGWLDRATHAANAEGHAHFERLLGWANALAADEIPDLDDAAGGARAIPQVPGHGTYDDPWEVRWPGSAADGPRLQLWLEPDGPPSAWAAGLGVRAAASDDLDAIASVIRPLTAFSPRLAEALSGMDAGHVAGALDALQTHCAGGDGVVPLPSQSPEIFGWDHGEPLTAAHHDLPRDAAAIAQILSRIDDLAGGAAGERVVLLLGPSFGSAEDWGPLLASPLRHGAASAGAHFNLRVPGIDPLTFALDGVTAVSDYYTADLADDGSGNLSRLVTQIERVVARLGVLRGAAPVTLVAHSTAGIAARAFAAAHAPRAKGLITLGTPHLGASLPFLTEPLVGDGVRIAHAARDGAAATPIARALDHLLAAMDGYVETGTATLPRRQPYPFASFNSVGPFDTGEVRVLALGSALGETLVDILKADAQTLSAAGAGLSRRASHLAGGIALPLQIAPAREGEVEVEAALRVGLFQIALEPDGPPAPRAPHMLRAEARIHRGEDWLLGGPSTFPVATDVTNPLLAFVDRRAREIRIGLDVSAAAAAPSARPWFTIVQGAFRGPTRNLLTDADPLGHEVLGEVLDQLAAHAEGASAARQLLDALQAIGLVVTDANGVVGLSADAWLALGTDPIGTLGGKIPPALARPEGWLGLQGPADGPWIWAPPGSPIELVVTESGPGTTEPGWRLALRATSGAEGDESPTLEVGVDYSSRLPAFAPTAGVRLGIGPVALRFDAAAGTLALEAPPWLGELRLAPSSPADLRAQLNDALPRVLFSAALSAALGAIAPGVRAGAVERFFRAPGDFLQSAEALGRAEGPGFDGGKIAQLLRTINELAEFPAGAGLQLPGSLSIGASGAGTDADPLTLSLSTTAPIGGVLELAAGVRVDGLRHASPTGTIALDTPLGGSWPRVAVRFGVDARGVTLSILPEGQPAIQILPAFSGLGALRGAAAALLPQVLDALVEELGSPRPDWLQRLLDVATALRLYDEAGRFAAHASELRALLEPNWRDTFDASLRSGLAAAVASLINAIPDLPGTAAASAGLFTWSVPVGAPDRRVGLAAGWTGDDPAVRLFAERLELGTGALRADVALGVGPAGLECDGALAASLSAIGLAVTPTLAFSLDAGEATRFSVRVLPLADAGGDGPLTIALAPEAGIESAAGTAERLIADWALPLLVRALIEAERDELGRHLWTDGPTLQDALTFAGVLDGTAAVVAALPPLGRMTTGLLTGLADADAIELGTLRLGLVSSDGRVGLRLGGYQDFDVGSLELSMRFGAPASWTTAAGGDEGTPGADGGLQVFLLRTDAADIELDVGVVLAGVGIGIAGESGTKIVDTAFVRIGELRTYLFLDVETRPSLRVDHVGAGAELIGFGLPLGAATGGNVGGSNPVAANLLRSDGAAGDSHPVNPDVDVEVWYWEPEGTTGNPLHVRFGGETGVIWIGVHAGFGPIYIDQVGITADSEAASLLIDGGVSVAGLSAQVDDLTVRVPYSELSDPTHWTLDLRGLGLGFTAPGVVIAGALVKYDGPPIEYNGMLIVKVAQIGAIAVGSYAVVGTGAGEYPSIAIFGGVFIPVGVPPLINITGLGLGLGYNRRIVVPEDVNEIPRFFMIRALDDPEALANNPMQALLSFRESVPASRGSLWLAAGLRGTSFEVVHVTAVLYVALDRGVEVGLLGLARMALPSDEAPLASVELALKARFSAAEGLFSVQAQLTDNSWMLSRDCQLTGGFAYFLWFRESQFLLTLGGYHPAFQARPEYPIVPRLGYHWNYGGIQLKGESYFALTHTCVMAGARLEATYGREGLQLWFNGYADFLLSWEPFHYDARVGISVGARVRIKVCFWKCVRITVSVSVGADLHLEGPPLHGTAKIDLCVTSVTIPFGSTANPRPPALPWEQFRLKYLMGADPATLPVGVQVAAGLLPAEPAGGKVAAGTQAEPWSIAAEWTFRTETRMPARGFAFQTDDARAEGEMSSAVFGRYAALAGTYTFDLAPMFVASSRIGAIHRLTLFRRPEAGGAFAPLVPRTAPVQPADRTFVLDERMFRIRPVIGQVSEATYHFFPDLKPPAAANTLPALTGLELEGVAFLEHPSAVIPIAKLRDASNPRPLPFAHDSVVFDDFRAAGLEAEQFAGLAEGRTGRRLLDAYAQIVSGPGAFAARRVESRLPADGLPPVAARTLRTRRSSPPMLSTLSFGLAMRPVEQPLPAPVREVVPQAPVALDAVRLRAVMQQTVAPTAAAASVRTSVGRAASAAGDVSYARVNVGRDLMRAVAVPGARLVAQPDRAAPQATRLSRTATSIRSGEIGAAVGRGTARTIARLEKEAEGAGVALRAGVTQLWDVPPAKERRLRIARGLAVRVTLLDSGGSVIADGEYRGARDLDIELPDTCAMAAVTGLGLAPALRDAVGDGSPGAVTATAAPHGATPVVGWERRQTAPQLTPTVLVGRGATIHLSQRAGIAVGGQALGVGMVSIAEALRGQTAIETTLPASTRVVGVLLDLEVGRALSPGDFAIASAGARLAGEAIRVEGGNRVLLLYDVSRQAGETDPKPFSVTVALRRGAHCAGVVGLGSDARTLGEGMNGRIPERLVPDEPLSADGEALVRFVRRS